ncbi:putative ADAMTS-like protein 2 isoform X1 [Apostichopus japonicus]|uniref:Putative ADAMTS-like protein 2 isoform X1 n=1 Tax=Stichopus japonicus TaxID=307972 RepID=A0A2G8KBP3_STIJA|nr:putative ADAMTS-like protein 2 isoform X1 [Apostichopus japonicus]
MPTVINAEVVLPSRWSDYGVWSSCSRTCGSGIQDRKRECFHKISNELLPDEDCLGEAKQIKLCKQQDCPQGTFSDFRKEECSQLSTAEMTWKPLYYPDDPAINPCWLGCYSNQAISWKIVTQEVPDGTHCVTRSGSGVCIENECLSYGCDGIIGSTKERDICGVCEGDETSCNVVASTKIVNHLQVGYNEALDIPSGARNVKVFELSGGQNYLASGSLCSYQRLESLERKAGVTHREMFTCSGPINETVTVMILTRDRSPSYLAYEYTLPLGEVSTPPPTALPETSLKPTSVTTEENEGTVQISSNSDPEIVPFSDEAQVSDVFPTTSAMLSGFNWMLADLMTTHRMVEEDSLFTTTTTAKSESDTSSKRGVTLKDSVESITARPDLSLSTTGGPVESTPDHRDDFKSLTSFSLDDDLGNAENSPQGSSATSAPATVTLLVKSSSLGQDLPEITDRDVKPTTTSTLEATALPPEDGMFKGSDGYPTRSENVTPFGEDFTNSRNLETAATKSFI